MVTAFPTRKILPPQICEKIISDSNRLSVRLTEAKFRLCETGLKNSFECLPPRISPGLIVFRLELLP
ncbi:MAG: hypothetical protein EWV81_06195 [Microcystis aeruginosa Ma_SC_T_19800800_S464]|uniref:Uncharacterized protein n=1 Tax=Microcystis aeruginosa Ma_SC_T_19800800_S464 TaxID=2486257 RepID=A0A552E0I7_MICAE|nr:MAG: hypothetical protein EWV81_06195 [Microcystis aeruginosa Ma_SC_T_19800800_S464]